MNRNAVLKLAQSTVTHEIGRVLAVDPVIVRAGGVDHEAKRATSCLVEPLANDIVELAIVPNGAAYVVAVFERTEGVKATLSTDGDLELVQRKGKVTIVARDGIDLVASSDVSVVSQGLRVNASDGNVVLQKLAFVGGLLGVELGKVKLLAQAVDTVVGRFSQRAKNVYRTVEESDHLRAGRIDYTAKSSMSLHGENALLTAEQLVKVDGEQIHLG